MAINRNNKLLNLRDKEEFFEEEILKNREQETSFQAQVLEEKEEKIKNNFLSAGAERKLIEENKTSGLFDKAVRYLLYFLIFSLPLFVLPFPMEIFEFNKTILLFVISSLAFLVWIAKMIFIEKRLILTRTPLDIPIVIFTLLVVTSTIFSVDKVSSVLGFYGRFSDSLLVYLSLIMLYFVIVNSIVENGSRSMINNFIKTFLISSFFVVFISLVYFLDFKFIPWNEAQFRSFNLVGGSLNVLAIYLVVVLLVVLGYQKNKTKDLLFYGKIFLLISSLFILSLIDFILAWIVLAIVLSFTMGIIIFLNSRSSQKNIVNVKQYFISTGLVVIISLVFIVSSLTFVNKDVQHNFTSSKVSSFARNIILKDIDNASREGFTREVIIEKQTAMMIMKGSLKNHSLLGSGPGTYLYNFSKFRPAEFNNNIFWNIRFDKAGSEVLEKISTIGALGVLSYLLIIVFVIIIFVKTIFWFFGKSELKGSAEVMSFVYLFSAWFGLLLFQFFYLESTTTKFVFWLLTAILVGQYLLLKRLFNIGKKMEPVVFNLQGNRKMFAKFFLIFLIITGFFLGSYYYQVRFYQADMAYKNALVNQNSNQEVNSSGKIINLNPYRGEYEVYASNYFLTQFVKTIKERIAGDTSEENIKKTELEAKNSIDHIARAITLGLNNVSFYQKLGSTYAVLNRELNVKESDEWAIKGYQRAIELEPNNPVLYVDLGRIYVLQFQRLDDDEKIILAIEKFERAIELKDNYADAILELSLAYELKGDYEKALNVIDTLEKVGSININTAFQLGRVYYNFERYNEAKNIFLEIIRIESKNSNAHYSLGLIYEKEENNQDALREFKIVSDLNPDNKEVAERIVVLEEKLEENKKEAPAFITIPEPIIE